MKTGLILMTALPPTKGHRLLIDYAYNYMSVLTGNNFRLFVLINGRKVEPISVEERYCAIQEEFVGVRYRNLTVVSYEGDIPQEPEDHPDFWSIWKTVIAFETKQKNFDYVFASEKYGIELANQLNAKFIPCNIYREVIDVSATRIRENPLDHFDELLPEFQQYAKTTVTIFGPESIGKTTLAKSLKGYFVPEWAREYLEQVAGPEITDEKMETIVLGQSALERSVDNFRDKPFVIRDTDLLSTYGYYKLWKGLGNFDETLIRRLFKPADLYIVQNEQIPFEPDPLRYGLTKRETDNKYWTSILDDFGLPYYQIQSLSSERQILEATKMCKNAFYRKTNWTFFR